MHAHPQLMHVSIHIYIDLITGEPNSSHTIQYKKKHTQYLPYLQCLHQFTTSPLFFSSLVFPLRPPLPRARCLTAVLTCSLWCRVHHSCRARLSFQFKHAVMALDSSTIKSLLVFVCCSMTLPLVLSLSILHLLSSCLSFVNSRLTLQFVQVGLLITSSRWFFG